MELIPLSKYINRLVTQSIFPALKNLLNDSAQRIEKAIKDKEYETLSPTDITTPLLQGMEKVEKAVSSQKFPEYPKEMTIGNIGEAKTDLTELIKVFKEEIQKLDKEVVVKNDLGQLLGLFKSNGDKKDLIKALERIESKIPTIKQQEITDYTLLFNDLITKIEQIPIINLSNVEKILGELKKLSEENGKSFKGTIVGRGGGYSSVGVKNASEARMNPASEETQLLVKTAIEGISGGSSYNEAYGKGVLSSGYYYWGYQLQGGTAWRIKRLSDTTSAIQWATGASDLATAWADKEGQTYASTL